MILNIASPSEQVKNFGHAHTAATTAREPVAIGGKLFIPLNTAAANERNTYVYETEIDNAPAETGVAWVPGDALYWDATSKKLTKTDTGNTRAGNALHAKAAAAEISGLVAFNSFV